MLYATDHALVWDDPLAHRQYPLARNVERLLALFRTWHGEEFVSQLGDTEQSVARWRHLFHQLIDAEILVREGSPRDRREQQLLRTWERWGAPTTAFHFATRTLETTSFRTQQEQDAAFGAKMAAHAPPPAFREAGELAPSLPPAEPFSAGLWETLYSRRSRRAFGTTPVPARTLATLLHVAAGRVPGVREWALDAHQTAFKTSPSGGGRHPTDLYPIVRRVSDVPSGIYRYDGLTHRLSPIRGAVTDSDVRTLCGDQDWAIEAALILVYTSVFPRSMYKYDAARTYRVLLLDAGHLSQTVYLLATALGLHMTFTGAIRDEVAEDFLQLNAGEEFPIGCAVVGPPPPELTDGGEPMTLSVSDH